MNSPVRTGQVLARDGTPIHYEVIGANPDAPHVALVHSLAMNGTFWHAVADALGDDASVLAIDARGHGASGKAAGPYTAALMADDLREVLDHLGWDRVLVGGASMGGCVAQQFAIKNPARVSALALLGTTAWYGPTAMADWHGRAEKALSDGLRSLVDFQKTRWFSDAFRANHPAAVQQAIDIFLKNDVRAYAATCEMLGSFDVRASLQGIRVPTAILVGEEDYAAPPAMARVLHESIAGSTLAEVPKARHLLPLEMPELVADTLRELLARAGGASR